MNQIADKNSALHSYVEVNELQVDAELKQFVDGEVLPATGLKGPQFWQDFSDLVVDLAPANARLLEKRERLQQQIDQWHLDNPGAIDKQAYRVFLEEIGYIVPAVADFKISTANVDDEIAAQAGPQLVVPVKNARFALNAANARWGSLYDAFYGTDAIADEGSLARGQGYNVERGAKVVAMGRDLLDEAAPLHGTSHHQVSRYFAADGALRAEAEGQVYGLAQPEKFVGYQGELDAPTAVLLKNNGLHIEVLIDPNSPIGASDKAGVKDIVMEAALTTIMDCEDSVAAVDAEDKIEVYRNWLGLNRGDLNATFEKGGHIVERTLHADREFLDPQGNTLILPGRSLLFVRNVGHLMTTPAIRLKNGDEIPEGIMDGVITTLIAMHDLKSLGRLSNSRKKSVYIVKPKMHGPEEVAFTDTLFGRIEKMLSLPHATIKMGIMDEERRTTVNLKACINQARDRTVFINTGFLDRTGDEIHTSMRAGPVVPKTQMKTQTWIQAYETWNVDIGIDCGLPGKAQIGKGMWAMPDLMADMLKNKIVHPEAGANTAWVPSPTAATLHAIHYHRVDVFARQKTIATRADRDTEQCFEQLLEIPLLGDKSALTPDIIRAEIDNNCQGILGYVVRWIDQGIGCSKVPDINNVGLMEDRATLRISSQHLANWLLHGICTKEEVEDALARMAKVVDEQNSGDPNYEAMVPNLAGSIAFKAASDLILLGVNQPSGYTEPLLHAYRLKKKQGIEGT